MSNFITLRDSRVIFYPDSHSYTLDGKELSGITSVLERQLFPQEYANVPDFVLRKAAEYGTSVHDSLEKFDAFWTNDGSREVADYITLCREHDLTYEESEYLVTDGTDYASMIDKVYRKSHDTFILADIKSYGVMTPSKLEKARWQLSIYRMFFLRQNPGAKVDRLLVIHLRNKPKRSGTVDHISKMIPVEPIPEAICQELLDADRKGIQFNNPF